MLTPPLQFADIDSLDKQFLYTDFTAKQQMDEDCHSRRFENTQGKHECLAKGECSFRHIADEVHPLCLMADTNCTLQQLAGWPRLSSRSTGGILKRSSSYKNRKQGNCREGRQRHYTSSDYGCYQTR